MKQDFFYFLVDDTSSRDEVGSFPLVDLLLTSEDVRIMAEVPGVSEADLEVKLLQDVLVLKGTRREPECFSRATHFYKLESFYGKFRKKVVIPVEIKPEDVTVNLKDGVLLVVIPRKRKKVIQIPVD